MNQNIMQQYKILVPFLGEALGENTEIVLQDMYEKAIVAMANNHVTNRKIGSPLTDYALRVLKEETWREKDYVCNYIADTNGKKLLSSTLFIKDCDELLGMLCINIDNHKYYELAKQLLILGGIKMGDGRPLLDSDSVEEPVPVIENMAASVDDLVTQTIDEFSKENNWLPADHYSAEDRMEIIKRMNEKNVFLIKGAVSMAAAKLQCSEASIYRYISKLQ